MKHYIILTISFIFIFFSKSGAQTFNLDWAKKIHRAIPKSIDTQNKNIIMCGSFSGTVDFNPSSTAMYNLTAYGSAPLFIEKLDSLGNFNWVKQVGAIPGTFNNALITNASLKTDHQGNIYIAGSFKGTVDFDPDTLITNSVQGHHLYNNIFILKLDSSGNFIWVKTLISSGDDRALFIDIDIFGNLYIVGTFQNRTDFDPGPGTYNLITSSSSIINNYILKLNSSGGFVWAKKHGGIGTTVEDFKLDNSSNLILYGSFYGTIDFDPSSAIFNLISYNSNYELYVVKIQQNGSFVWAKSFGGPNTIIEANSFVLDNLNNIYTTGLFSDSANFNPGTLTYKLNSSGKADIFIQKLNSLGDFLWAKSIAGLNHKGVSSIQINNFNSIYLIGEYNDTIDIDPNPSVNYNLHNNNTITKNFIGVYDHNGNFQYAADGNETIILETQLYGSNELILFGVFNGTQDFDYDPNNSFTMLGFYSGFIQKINLPLSTSIQNIKNSDFLVQLYPNPSVGTVHINVEQDLIGETLEIFSINGKKLDTRDITSNSTTLDFDYLPNGVYLLKSKSINKKFIINR